MVIFHSYVSLPEGIPVVTGPIDRAARSLGMILHRLKGLCSSWSFRSNCPDVTWPRHCGRGSPTNMGYHGDMMRILCVYIYICIHIHVCVYNQAWDKQFLAMFVVVLIEA